MLAARNVSGFARAASVPDDLVAQFAPAIPWQERHESSLDLLWIFAGSRKPETNRESLDVGVDDETSIDLETVAEHDIGGFASNPTELQKLVHSAWNVPTEPFHQGPTGLMDRLRLAPEQADRSDVGFNLGWSRTGKVRRGRECFEECWSHLVDTDVGSLC